MNSPLLRGVAFEVVRAPVLAVAADAPLARGAGAAFFAAFATTARRGLPLRQRDGLFRARLYAFVKSLLSFLSRDQARLDEEGHCGRTKVEIRLARRA